MMSPALKGSLLAMCTMTIWSGWNIVSRMGMVQVMTAEDICFLRFTTAGVIALPLLWRYRQQIFQVRGWVLALMAIGAGVPYVLVASLGFHQAPAAHGVLIPAAMTAWVAVLSWGLLKEHFSVFRKAGYGVIILAIVARLLWHRHESADYLAADGFFIVAALLWAVFTVAGRVAALRPMAAVAWISSASLFFFCIPYGLAHTTQIAALPLKEALVQVIYQGVVVSFVALLCYNKAMLHLGAARTSAFAALIPLLTTLLSMLLLHEYPTMADMAFASALSAGVLLATGFFARPLAACATRIRRISA